MSPQPASSSEDSLGSIQKLCEWYSPSRQRELRSQTLNLKLKKIPQSLPATRVENGPLLAFRYLYAQPVTPSMLLLREDVT